MSLVQEHWQLLKPYYLFNILLSISFVVLKRIPRVCNYLFNSGNCEFDGRETQILFFLLIVVVMRNRKTGSLSMLNYISSCFLYAKIANLVLWFNADYIKGIVYAIVFVLGALLLPEPTYSGTDNVTYFRGEQSLTEQLAFDKSTWLVAFYTAWNPACVNFAPVFAKISNDYGLDNLKFGKIDIGRFPEAGKKYKVSDSYNSKQLPTLILFEQGKESYRCPQLDYAKGKVIPFVFSEENIKHSFGLSRLFDEAKKVMKPGKNNSVIAKKID